jgi:hypothetical protein
MRRAFALATIVGVVGMASVSSAGPHRRRPTRFQGTWIWQSLGDLSVVPNPDRCGDAGEATYSVRGIDNLGGLYTAEFNQCFGRTETGLRTFDTTVITTYESGATTEAVCGESVAVRNDEQCSQSWSKSRCVFVNGTGALAGIRGFAITQSVESGSDCDGSGGIPNSNDAGAYWSQGIAFLRR